MIRNVDILKIKCNVRVKLTPIVLSLLSQINSVLTKIDAFPQYTLYVWIDLI